MFHVQVDSEIDLRLLQPRHAEPLFALVEQNRDYLREWLPWVDGTRSADDSEQFIQHSLQQFADGNGFSAGIWYRSELAGCIGFHDPDRAKVELGYWLAEPFQGKGIMTRACHRVVTYAFSELMLNRVQIFAAATNHKSRAVPERLGFKQEGMLRETEWLYDRFIDLVVYGVLAQEWSE
ncbi:GNAT family N-acetyltransferase [Leptolyngbya sp. FACHB-36]|uniref:GNAT family N-acetyltransferase n=1 Tax=Leptolyngbya sp. FACHB-36 TaxID=2692808 RepID=UPI001681BF7E|nr:GNAT family protein [Leptolyngbya sp. FACHB-36]MBD2021437.1 GNAT family N-acetyltransferase [Leptolyngbya sp. FACHB-36]